MRQSDKRCGECVSLEAKPRQLSLFETFRELKKKFFPSLPPPRAAESPVSRTAGPSPLRSLWLELRREYFPERQDLDSFTVAWSKRRQKRTLASCSFDSRRVKVARELDYPEHLERLKAVLYHEMCHAFLGKPIRKDGRFPWHGPEFRALERRCPLCRELDRWVKEGGWAKAVRSDRAKRAARSRADAGSSPKRKHNRSSRIRG